jgi:hypothetical protein
VAPLPGIKINLGRSLAWASGSPDHPGIPHGRGIDNPTKCVISKNSWCWSFFLSPEGQKSRSGRSGQVTSRLCFSITHILADGYSTTPPRPPERDCKYRISSDGSRSCQTEWTRDCCGDGQVEQLNAYRALLTPYHEAKPKDSNLAIEKSHVWIVGFVLQTLRRRRKL